MGTASAVKYATLYCAIHEENTIIPKYGQQMLYFRRYIDDIFIIWNNDGPFTWQSLQEDLTYGILQWEVNKPSLSVNFLDLTIGITKKGSLQKPTRSPLTSIYACLQPAVTPLVSQGALLSISSLDIGYKIQTSLISNYKLKNSPEDSGSEVTMTRS